MSADDILTQREQAARDAVRGLSVPRADAAFRDRLRREFVAGTIATPASGRKVVAGPWRRPAALATLLPIAASLIAIFIATGGSSKWEVVQVVGDGIVVVDQRPIPANHRDDLARALKPGARIQANGATLELKSGERLALQITDGTDMTLPRRSGGLFDRAQRGAIRSGEIRMTTGKAFRRGRLLVDTPEAQIEVRGTTLAVIREPAGTCVCVLEGRVMVGPKDTPMQPIEAGRRGFVFADGRPMEVAGIRPPEVSELGTLRDRHDHTGH